MQKGIRQLFEEFIYECEYARKLRPGTLKGYTHSFHTFSKFASIEKVTDITPGAMVDFFYTLENRNRIVGKGMIKTGVRKSTLASYWCKLNPFFSWLVTNRQLQDNPLKKLHYPTPKYEDKKFLSKKEVERILSALYRMPNSNMLLFKRNLVFFHLLLFSGLRKEEVMLLQVRDVDLEKRMLTIRPETTKMGKGRTIPIHTGSLLLIKDYLQQRKSYTTQYFIVSISRDDRLSYDGLRHLMDRVRSASGVAFHLHQLRHTFAVNFLKSTNNIFKLKTILGHKDISVTMLYLRCIPPEELRQDINTMHIGAFV